MHGRRGVSGTSKTGAEVSHKEDSDGTVEIREFYTVSQLAGLLQLKEMAIYQMVNQAQLPCSSIGSVKDVLPSRHRGSS